MKTDDLIARLAADQPPQQRSAGLALAVATLLAIVCAGGLMLLTTGLRPDFMQALGTWRFDMKFVLALTLASSAFFLLRRAIYPEGYERAPLWIILAAPAMLAVAVCYELAVLPASAWRPALVGTNWLHCLTLVPLFGLLPLLLALWGLRHGAPTRPALTGFLAGLLAGSAGAVPERAARRRPGSRVRRREGFMSGFCPSVGEVPGRDPRHAPVLPLSPDLVHDPRKPRVRLRGEIDGFSESPGLAGPQP